MANRTFLFANRRLFTLLLALGLSARAGAIPTSTETVLFDLVKRAEGENFRALTKLVK